MAWNIRHIETVLTDRLKSRPSLVALLGGTDRIRPEGYGEAIYPAVRYRIEDVPSEINVHTLNLCLTIETRDGEGISGHDQALDIAAELDAELLFNPYKAGSGRPLELSVHHYRVSEQWRTLDPGPVPVKEMPGTYRAAQLWRLIVLDES